MNGWAKISGAFSLIAGIVYLVGVMLAVMDGLDIGNAQLYDFAAVNKFKFAAIFASVLFAYAGACSIFNTTSKNPTSGIFGIFYVVAAITLLVSVNKADVSRISWEYMELILLAVVIATSAVFAIHAVKFGKYIVADISLLLILGIFVAYVYETKMIGIILDVVVLMIIGLFGIVCYKEDDEAYIAALAPAPEARVVVPASAPVPANLPIVKEKPAVEEPAKEEAPAKTVAAPAKAEAKPAEPAKAEEPAPAKAESAPVSPKEAKPAEPAKAEEPAPAKEEAPAKTVAASAEAEDVPAEAAVSEIEEVAEEPEEAPADIITKGWNVAVAEVGETQACEMDDDGILNVIKKADPDTHSKILAFLGISATAAAVAAEPAEKSEPLIPEMTDEELGLIPDTPSGFVRRACWNKGLRCRKDYGPYYIPFAFVRSKVAVYVDADVPDNRNDELLKSEGWIVLHFKESEITDGAKQADVVNDAVKTNTRNLKKAKTKAKKKR